MIVFEKVPAENNWIASENNIIFDYKDDDANKVPLYSEITMPNIATVRLFPDVNNNFYFNAKKYLRAKLNNIEDDIRPSIVDGDITTMLYDWSKISYVDTVEIKIFFDDGSEEVVTRDFYGKIQADQLIRTNAIGDNIKFFDDALMTRYSLKKRDEFYLKYWRGYPFDLAFARNITSLATQQITTISNGTTGTFMRLPFQEFNQINRLFFDEGKGYKLDTLPDPLVLQDGINILSLRGVFALGFKLEVITPKCENNVYIKWMNEKGGFNYWLFENSSTQVSSTNLGLIENDYNNLEDTLSQKKSLGSEVSELLTVSYDSLTLEDINILETLIYSPKVYLYMAGIGAKFNPFIRPQQQLWTEISLRNKTIITKDFKNRVPSGDITFNLPSKYTIKL